MAAVHKSQEKMGQAMKRMSNELQELVQRDASIEGEEETKPLLATINWDKELLAPTATSSLEQPVFSTPSPWLARIPESEEGKASVKDSVTSGVPARVHGEGVEASESSKHLAIPEFKFGFGGSFMAGDGGTEEGAKLAFVVPIEEQKGKLSMDPMVEALWKSIDFLAPTEELISLVGKSMGMPTATSGSFIPQIVGIGQMKLEAPPQYFGKRQPGLRV